MTEIEIIVATISHPAGFAVELFGGLLSTRRLEDGRFIVSAEIVTVEGNVIESNWEKVFEDAEAAANFFTHSRRQRSLGFDCEQRPQHLSRRTLS